MKRLTRLSIATAAICMALGASPACWAQSAPTPIVAKQLDLTIHMHFRDKFVWDENWPVAKELTRLTNIKLVNTASKATC